MAAKKKSARRGGLKKRVSRTRPNGHGSNGVMLNQHGRQQVPCLSCGLCCTYVAVEVDGPTGITSATEILWYLYHERVSVYRDEDDEWLLQFETRCQHLQADNKCRIYQDRPHVCRAFDERSCEINVDGEGRTFHTPADFIEYLRTSKKSIYRKLEGRFLPPEATRDGKMVNPGRLPTFESRYRRLRVLGTPPV